MPDAGGAVACFRAVDARASSYPAVPRAAGRDRTETPEASLVGITRTFHDRRRTVVALARALITNPNLLVADEATSILDVSTRAGVAGTLRRLADERDLAVLFVTHDLGEAVQLCDRILVLKDGVAVETGTPAGLVAQSIHPYTAKLLGAASASADQQLW